MAASTSAVGATGTSISDGEGLAEEAALGAVGRGVEGRGQTCNRHALLLASGYLAATSLVAEGRGAERRGAEGRGAEG
eukprot:CAMPEP_0174711106 /NCGR_PEP_ID=MMETSP1094-20130205/12528_1 /TAXON_ID=156173 /ORGANISM="Chrysochromulina brevifilum, Strain UTEX LB 985" /LENGTH=77 /DNA_ID=CAMNT_0015909997 /DNA_START=422 /DNA_END=655 /DNA_ORIENTATION=+